MAKSLAARLESISADLIYYLNSGEPCQEEQLRHLRHELTLTQQLVLNLPSPSEAEGPSVPLTPEQVLLALQETRSSWVAQFPEDVRQIIEAL